MRNRRKRIALVMQYHNNLYDSIRALDGEFDVQVLSVYRQVADAIYMQQGVHIVPDCHTLGDMMRETRTGLDVLMVKHLWGKRHASALLVALLRRARIVVMIQRVPRLSPRIRQFALYGASLLYRLLDARVMAVTKEGYDDVRPYFPRVQYVPACVDPDRFKQARFSNAGTTLRLLTIAKYQPRKELAQVVRAVDQLRQAFPRTSFQLTIIGSYYGEEGQRAYSAVRNLVAELGMHDAVQLEDHVPAIEMSEYIATADLFVLTARREQLGYAVVEAMAAGLPVIVSRDSGAASYVDSGRNGYLIEPGSAGHVVRAVSHFLYDDGLVRRDVLHAFSERSRAIIKEAHTPSFFRNQFLELIAE